MNMTPDQQKQVAIRLGYEDMRFHNGQWWGCRLGIYEIRIGSNWDLLGACLNRMAEMGEKIILEVGEGYAKAWHRNSWFIYGTPLEAALVAFIQTQAPLRASQGDA